MLNVTVYYCLLMEEITRSIHTKEQVNTIHVGCIHPFYSTAASQLYGIWLVKWVGISTGQQCTNLEEDYNKAMDRK
jgi:hypothetical protein